MKVHGHHLENPPSEWAGVGARPLGGDVYWWYDPAAESVLRSILVWHWCPRWPQISEAPDGKWIAANVAAHDLVSIDPLHLDPSLLWECCGKHGWVRAGAWSDA